MRREIARRWAGSAALVVVAGLIFVADGPSVSTIIVAAIMIGLAYATSPWFFPRSPTDAEARRLANERGVPVIYWRVGCSYCLRMRIALGLAGNRAVWMDVSRDPLASARVRDVTGGDETVPTVFAGTTARVNPSPRWVKAQLETR